MEVYRSYWRDDPEFDRTNTCAAAPHLPCPAVDKTLLRLACEFAVRSNFGWPKPPQQIPKLDVEEKLAEVSLPTEVPQTTLGVVVSGPGGGAWQLGFQGDALCAVTPGLHRSMTEIVYLSTPTLAALLQGSMTTAHAAKCGQVLCLSPAGDPGDEWMTKFAQFLEALGGASALEQSPRFQVPLATTQV